MKDQLVVGKKVWCVRPSGWLKANKIYTIQAVSALGYIYLKEPFIRGGYCRENFVPVVVSR